MIEIKSISIYSIFGACIFFYKKSIPIVMNKRQPIVIITLLAAAIFLLSWGVTGHRAVGKIAADHLSPKARAAVQELLGNSTLSDVSTWPDEILRQPEYRHTAPWHYLNLPLGLSYADFEKKVVDMKEENVYSALVKEEGVLGNKETTREEKTEALKFVVHFVGDLHQPMHISRAEDKGGNTIQLNYEGKGTNLHSVWDTRLIEHEGLTYEQLAEKYGQAGAAQIRQWQSDPVIKWIWESYQISTKLYAEIDAMKDRTIDDSYYQAHIGIIHERIEQAGIRLAGVLNTIFANGLAASKPSSSVAGANAGSGAAAPLVIEIGTAAQHINGYITTCAKVYGYKTLDNMTLVNLGAAYPDQLLTLVLQGDAKEAYKGLDGQQVCVTGSLVLYKDKPEMIITDPKMIGIK